MPYSNSNTLQQAINLLCRTLLSFSDLVTDESEKEKALLKKDIDNFIHKQNEPDPMYGYESLH